MNLTINSDNFVVGLFALIGVYSFFVWLYRAVNRRASSISPANTNPSIVVNVPAEFKPIGGLPPTEIEGARAALWYTVYAKAIEGFTGDGAWTLDSDDETEACNSATKAVDKVFGPTP
jgi:hypothetical protein